MVTISYKLGVLVVGRYGLGIVNPSVILFKFVPTCFYKKCLLYAQLSLILSSFSVKIFKTREIWLSPFWKLHNQGYCITQNERTVAVLGGAKGPLPPAPRFSSIKRAPHFNTCIWFSPLLLPTNDKILIFFPQKGHFRHFRVLKILNFLAFGPNHGGAEGG